MSAAPNALTSILFCFTMRFPGPSTRPCVISKTFTLLIFGQGAQPIFKTLFRTGITPSGDGIQWLEAGFGLKGEESKNAKAIDHECVRPWNACHSGGSARACTGQNAG